MAYSAADADSCMWRILIAVLCSSLTARGLTPAQVVVVYNEEINLMKFTLLILQLKKLKTMKWKQFHKYHMAIQ